MKKIFFNTLVLLLGFSITLTAQKKDEQTSKAKVDGPQFKFKDGDTYDFGVVPVGPDAIHEFEFTNTGTRPLIITEAKPSCSCTTPEWSKDPVMPGKTAKIKVGYKAAKPGLFHKEIYLQSNAVLPEGELRYTIYIKGEVK